MMYQDRDELVDLLLQCHSVRRPETLSLILERCGSDIQVRVQESQPLLPLITQLVTVCANTHGGMARLVAAVKRFEGESIQIGPVERWLARHQARVQSEMPVAVSATTGAAVGAAVSTAAGAAGLLWNVPDLPPYYLPRPELEDGLIAQLVSQRTGQRTGNLGISSAHKAGIHGMGGIGKTVLATAAVRDERIRAHFTDGILWLTLGQEPRLLKLQATIARLLGIHEQPVVDIDSGAQRLKSLLADKKILLVLDDVWSATDAFALSVVGPGGRLLLTTRDRRILASIGAEEQSLDVLSAEQSIELLASCVGENAGDLAPEAAVVARQCGYLPLALSIVGAMVRCDVASWTDILELLDQCDLDEIEHRFPHYPYPSVLRALDVSVRVLPAELRQQYLELAIFAEDDSVPESALVRLWSDRGSYPAKLRKSMRQLAARSLATYESGHLRLHDLQRMYVLRMAEDIAAIHEKLIDAYASDCQGGWESGPDDGYFFQRLAYHLSCSGQVDKLAELLSSYAWLEAKIRQASAIDLIDDYSLLAENQELQLIRDALRLSSHIVRQDVSQLPTQLIGRLCYAERSTDGSDSALSRVLDGARGAHDFVWLCPIFSSHTPAGGPLVRTMVGHLDWINAIAVTTDGRFISASDDRTVRVWDMAAGTLLDTRSQHKGYVRDVAVTPDNRYAISASHDRTLIVWDLDSGTAVTTLRGHAKQVNAVVVSPDGRRVVSGSEDWSLIVWDRESGQVRHTLSGHKSAVNGLAMASDGKVVLSASEDRSIGVWDLENGRLVKMLSGHSDIVTAVAISSDATWAVSASDDKTLAIWDLVTHRRVRTLSGHGGVVTDVAISGDGKNIISASTDKTLRVWDPGSGDILSTIRGHEEDILSLGVSADGRYALSGGKDRFVKLWDLTRKQSDRPSLHFSPVTRVAISDDATVAVTSDGSMDLRVWNLLTGEAVGSVPTVGRVAALAMARSDGEHFLVVGGFDSLQVWNLDKGRSFAELRASFDDILDIAIADDGLVRAVTRNGRLVTWPMTGGECLDSVVVKAPEERVPSFHSGRHQRLEAFAPPSAAIAGQTGHTLASFDGIKVALTVPGAYPSVIEENVGTINKVAISPAGRYKICANEHSIYLLEPADLREPRALLGTHPGKIRAMCFAQDERTLVSVSEDAQLRIWDVTTRDLIATFVADEPLVSCAIDRHGHVVMAGDCAGGVHVMRRVEPGESGCKQRIFESRAEFTTNRLVLSVRGADVDKTLIHVDQDEFRIGRGQDCDLRITSAEVSRAHATIVRSQGKFIIKDHSRHGTRVDGVPIEEHELRARDKIEIGNVQLLVRQVQWREPEPQ